jgi:hypothetical protein
MVERKAGTRKVGIQRQELSCDCIPESCGLTATMVERKAGTRKVGIQRQELSSSRRSDTAVRKNNTITPFRILAITKL